MLAVSLQLTAELLLTTDASLPLLKPLSAECCSSTRSVGTGRGLISPSNDVVMDHSSRLASSSAPGPGLFGSPSLSLHPASVLEGDLQDSTRGKQAKSKDSSVSLYNFFADLFGEGLSIRLSDTRLVASLNQFQKRARLLVKLYQSSNRKKWW